MPSSSELNIMLISCYLEQWPLQSSREVTELWETRDGGAGANGKYG